MGFGSPLLVMFILGALNAKNLKLNFYELFGKKSIF